MKHFYLVLLGMVCLILNANAQCADVTLSSQADVDSFQSTSGGCSTLSGVLTISGSDITDLTPLSGITSVGSLTVANNPQLTNLDGLSGLIHLEGEANYGTKGIVISDNPLLTSVSGLSGLSGSLGKLYILNNDALTNVDGFQNITTVSGNGIDISNNASLTSLAGLSQITGANPGLTVSNNEVLPNLDGLESLRIIALVRNSAVSIFVSNNPSLVDVDALSNLRTMNGNTEIIDFSNNPNLADGCGLFTIVTEKENICSACVRYNFEGSPITKESILAGGACDSPSQTTCYERVDLFSQADVDAFPTTHGCSIVEGFITITGDDIQNLDGLSGVTQVQSIHIASNPLLTDLSGLSHLRKATYFGVVYNDGIHDLSAISELTTVGTLTFRGMTLPDLSGLTALDSVQTIELEDNVAIGSLHGLETIENLASLKISRNGGLTNLEGLSGLKRVDELTIEGNTDLSSVSGVPNLWYVNKLAIGSSAALTNLNGFSALTRLSLIQFIANPVLASLQGLSNVTGGLSLIRIQSNPMLTNLNGLEHITSAGDLKIVTNSNLIDLTGLGLYYSGSIEINQNPKLTSLNGLNNLTRVDGGVMIIDHQKLTDISALSSITNVKGSVRIERNESLENIDGFSSLMSISQGPGDPGEALVIRSNPKLANFDGFHKLTNVNGDVVIDNNASLQNADSLSAWTTIKPGASLTVTRNHALTSGCGFYPILHNSNPPSVFSGNGVSKDAILAGGPCAPDEITAATNLTFADVTDNSMTISFSAGSGQEGYIVLMRAFQSSLPDEVPVNGTQYYIGEVIGCCSIVVGMGENTTHSLVYLEPDIDYYFDIIPYVDSSMFITDKALSGHQRTTPRVQPYPNPFVENVTIPFTIAEEGTSVKIMILDQLGRAVSEVVNDTFTKGKHEVVWGRNDLQGNKVGNGIYMYSIVTNESEPVKGLFIAK